jgi:antitoxin HicB
MNAIYPLSFVEEDGDIVVRSRDLPELLTAGYTQAEALDNAEDALAVVLLSYVEKGIALPAPTTLQPGERLVQPPASIAAKVVVWQAFVTAGISKSELARRMGVAEGEARRVLDPNHGTKLDRLDDAARALGFRLMVSAQAA